MSSGKNFFEDNLKKLEESVKAIEDGELPLKETLDQFEEGLKLSKLCTEELEKAQRRIEKLTLKDGEIISEPFEVKE